MATPNFACALAVARSPQPDDQHKSTGAPSIAQFAMGGISSTRPAPSPLLPLLFVILSAAKNPRILPLPLLLLLHLHLHLLFPFTQTKALSFRPKLLTASSSAAHCRNTL